MHFDKALLQFALCILKLKQFLPRVSLSSKGMFFFLGNFYCILVSRFVQQTFLASAGLETEVSFDCLIYVTLDY